MASPLDDDKTVHVEQPVPPPKASQASPAAAPAEPTPDPDKVYRERLKADHGIEDPGEIATLRERARRADELESQAYQYQQPRQPQYQPQPRQQQGFDMAQWQAYARVDPGGAYLQMQQMEGQRRQHEQAQQIAYVESRIRQAQEFSAAEVQAERYVRDEFPEAYNTSSKLHKEGQRVYSSMPALQSMGNGFELATKIAAANLGMVPKSKRQSTVTQSEVDDQAPERGTRRPPAESVDDSKPLTARQKKMAKDMGVSEKDYKTFQKARATGKNVKVS